MQPEVIDEVRRVFDVLRGVLSDTFSFDALANFTALYRKKTLRMEEAVLPVAITGYCIALQDVDLICTRQGLDAIHVVAVRLHEMAHLLLGHIPFHSDTATPSYATFVPHQNLSSTRYRVQVFAYDLPAECAAETLATLLLKCIFREQATLPPLARKVYG